MKSFLAIAAMFAATLTITSVHAQEIKMDTTIDPIKLNAVAEPLESGAPDQAG